MKRSSTNRDRFRAHWMRQKPLLCGLCGGEIDTTLKYPHPKSFVVDHIIPLHKGGADVLSNTQPAHRDENRTKGSRTDGAGIIKRSTSLAM